MQPSKSILFCPARIFNKLVFPAPEGPKIAVNLPGKTRPETSLRISLNFPEIISNFFYFIANLYNI